MEEQAINRGDSLFVYGTLRKGQRADLNANANKFSVQFLGEDSINGHIFHLGGYPGLKLIGPDPLIFDVALPIVKGEAFYIQNASAGALLDAYECYPYLYNRTIVQSQKGRILWVYTYNGLMSSDQLIETGDWTNPRLACSQRVPLVGG